MDRPQCFPVGEPTRRPDIGLDTCGVVSYCVRLKIIIKNDDRTPRSVCGIFRFFDGRKTSTFTVHRTINTITPGAWSSTLRYYVLSSIKIIVGNSVKRGASRVAFDLRACARARVCVGVFFPRIYMAYYIHRRETTSEISPLYAHDVGVSTRDFAHRARIVPKPYPSHSFRVRDSVRTFRRKTQRAPTYFSRDFTHGMRSSKRIRQTRERVWSRWKTFFVFRIASAEKRQVKVRKKKIEWFLSETLRFAIEIRTIRCRAGPPWTEIVYVFRAQTKQQPRTCSSNNKKIYIYKLHTCTENLPLNPARLLV